MRAMSLVLRGCRYGAGALAWIAAFPVFAAEHHVHSKASMNQRMAETATPLYGHAQLDRVFNPRSIALVGATPNPASFAGKTLANLKAFAGTLYLVNAKYPSIDGRTCYPSVAALPEAPDCVVVAVGREGVMPVIDDCIA